ncbi:MAG: hypothetical protein ABIN93_18775 [Ginsengibacter sp.]
MEFRTFIALGGNRHEEEDLEATPFAVGKTLSTARLGGTPASAQQFFCAGSATSLVELATNYQPMLTKVIN